MRITENRQKKLRQYIGAPKRLLRKARDFYIDAMVSFDGRVAPTNIMGYPTLQTPPKNFGRTPSKASNYDKFEELCKSIAKKFNWHSPESNNVRLNEREQRFPGYNGMDRSYSVTLGKIGTIDEDEPCDFQEHIIMKSEIVMPRCRSHAVTRGNVYY
ncbi:unnamed protein product [Fraxinus pennsylvanica]|uniref:Uncharacterized protein n=1 Tax=Fraxinus pennsylvanica TaxID=56036 RepID=A0AAD2EBR3_9LAMI|nr:unnamed protein product [Fraxinus pennsylvanica]